MPVGHHVCAHLHGVIVNTFPSKFVFAHNSSVIFTLSDKHELLLGIAIRKDVAVESTVSAWFDLRNIRYPHPHGQPLPELMVCTMLKKRPLHLVMELQIIRRPEPSLYQVIDSI